MNFKTIIIIFLVLISLSFSGARSTPKKLPDNINSTSINNKLDSMLGKLPSDEEPKLKPILKLETDELNFKSNISNLKVTISNIGTGELNWNLETKQEWITIGSERGVNDAKVVIFVSREGLRSGHHSGIIKVKSNGGDHAIVVDIDVDKPAPTHTDSSSNNRSASESHAKLDNSTTTEKKVGSSKRKAVDIEIKSPEKVGNSSVTISWSRSNSEDFRYYTVSYSPKNKKNIDYITIATLTDSNLNSYKLQNLQPGTTYYVRVDMYDTNDQIIGSNILEVSTNVKLGKWILADNIAGVSKFNSVWFNSSNDGYTVGANGFNGVIYHWNGKSWGKDLLPDGTKSLNDIAFTSSNNGYAIGDSGTIIHYNGSGWVKFPTPTRSSIKSFAVLAEDNIWITSARDIYHWNGSSWKKTTLDISTIKDIKFINSDNGYVIGSNGKVFYFNGFGWEFVDTFSSEVTSFSFFDDKNGWLTGNFGYDNFRYKLTNGSWSAVKRSNFNIFAVSHLSEDRLWSTGSQGEVNYFNGKDWKIIKTPAKGNLYGITMLSNNEGWAVGANGVILRYYVK